MKELRERQKGGKNNKYFTNLIKNMYNKAKEDVEENALYSHSNSRISQKYTFNDLSSYKKRQLFKKSAGKEKKHRVESSLKKAFKKKKSEGFFTQRKLSYASELGSNHGLKDNIRNMLESRLAKSKERSKDLFSRKRSKLLSSRKSKGNISSTSRLLGRDMSSERRFFY